MLRGYGFYWVDSHARHVLLPSALEYEPTSQSVQAKAPTLAADFPAAHATHELASFTRGWLLSSPRPCLPAAQVLQSVLPPMLLVYSPRLHGKHDSSLDAPVVLPFFPGSQSKHSEQSKFENRPFTQSCKSVEVAGAFHALSRVVRSGCDVVR